MPLVLDTGVILAALNAGDPDHEACALLIARHAALEPLLVPSSTLTELDYWVVKKLGMHVWTTFVDDLHRGAYVLEPLSLADIRRASQIEQTYEDLRLGFVDASIVAVCERLGETRVATLNDRDFRVVVPHHAPYFTLLPADG